MKSMLQQMYKGYEVVSNGYNSVKNISKGNFDLHDAFLNSLLLVSPTVRKYPRVKDIINDQATIMAEYKAAAGTFKQDKHITPDEIGNMMDVYNNIVSSSLGNLDELSIVMTDNKLRMSDDERLQLMDRIYAAGHDQLTFLRHFNDHARQVAAARAAQANDQQTIKKLYGLQ
ncbi:TerB family tellurite resistance protein [Mucilaginibacter mali]|nr:TerB family tellurite resistance protein [Mucilaginibacter mali]